MRFDFSRVEDVETFATVPEGVRLCRVAEVREGRARDGSVRWRLRLEAAEGEWAGRTAAWDSLTWSERGVHRVKAVLAALGFDVRGELVLEAEDLVGRLARVELVLEEWENVERGRREVRLKVPYLGYEPAGAEELAQAVDAWAPDGEPPPHDPPGGGPAHGADDPRPAPLGG